MAAQTVSIAVVAWKKLSTRSELLSKALNADLWFFKDKIPYIRASVKTLFKALQAKPDVILIQLPQGPLLLEAYLLKKMLGCKIIADIHTGFIMNTSWKGLLLNTPFVKLLPTADIIVAHNETQLALIPTKIKNKTIVVFDPWHLIVKQNTKNWSPQEKYIVFPASFASDEPLEEIISSINQYDLDVKIYVTGNWKRKPEIKRYSSRRIIFTGYLSNEEFSNLLTKATAIVTGTKREYTALMSGWEAVAYTKPLAVTATSTLRKLFEGYAVFYDWKKPESIVQAIKKVLETKPNLKAREKLRQRTLQSLKTFNSKIGRQ